jgi:hypothetical protein
MSNNRQVTKELFFYDEFPYLKNFSEYLKIKMELQN